MYICKRTVRAEEEETEKKTGKRNVCNMKAKEGLAGEGMKRMKCNDKHV